jgi:hypothetical protein
MKTDWTKAIEDVSEGAYKRKTNRDASIDAKKKTNIGASEDVKKKKTNKGASKDAKKKKINGGASEDAKKKKTNRGAFKDAKTAESHINKFLYQYCCEARPRQAHANMVLIKALHVRPDLHLPALECCLKVIESSSSIMFV